MSEPAAPRYKPTWLELRTLWMNRMPFTPLERYESAVGWNEFLADVEDGTAATAEAYLSPEAVALWSQDKS